MLELDRTQDPDQLQTRSAHDCADSPQAAQSPAAAQSADPRISTAAQTGDYMPTNSPLHSPGDVHAAFTSDAVFHGQADDNTQHHSQVAPAYVVDNQHLQPSVFPTSISKLANLLQHNHGKHVQRPLTDASIAHKPVQLAPHAQSSSVQPSLPASLLHVRPQHLNRLQLQNLQKAADLLSSARPISAPSVQAGQIASQPTRSEIAPRLMQNNTVAPVRGHKPAAAALSGESAEHGCRALPTKAAEAGRDRREATCSSASLHGSDLLLHEDYMADKFAAMLDSKLERMAHAVSSMYVDTVARKNNTYLVESSLANSAVPSSHLDHKQTLSAKSAEVSAGEPISVHVSSMRIHKADNRTAAFVQQENVCLPENNANAGQELDPVRTGREVQRKRFRKTTGLEVLYRTMPSLREQLFPSGIAS